DDHAHRVVEVRLPHLGFNVDRNHYRLILFVRHVSSCPTNALRIPVAHPFRGEGLTLFICSAPIGRKFLRPKGLSYNFFAARSMTQAFTVSNASAEFVKRRAANAASISRKNVSRSSSLANSIATPRSLSGASVGVARNSLTLNPRSPGSVAQPN